MRHVGVQGGVSSGAGGRLEHYCFATPRTHPRIALSFAPDGRKKIYIRFATCSGCQMEAQDDRCARASAVAMREDPAVHRTL